MTEQPEALRLADILQHKLPSVECLERAAAELRRLHGENERLGRAKRPLDVVHQALQDEAEEPKP
jgi:hypothetical protein